MTTFPSQSVSRSGDFLSRCWSTLFSYFGGPAQCHRRTQIPEQSSSFGRGLCLPPSFSLRWDPGSAFHKLFVWPPIVLLIGTYIASRKRLTQHLYAFHALAVAMAAWNFGAFIYPHSHVSADPVLVFAQTLDRQLPRNATVYYRVLDPDDWYLEYFAPGRTWSPLPHRLPATTNFEPPGPCLSSKLQRSMSSRKTRECLPNTSRDRFRATLGFVNSRHNIRLRCLKEHPLRALPRLLLTESETGRRECVVLYFNCLLVPQRLRSQAPTYGVRSADAMWTACVRSSCHRQICLPRVVKRSQPALPCFYQCHKYAVVVWNCEDPVGLVVAIQLDYHRVSAVWQ